MSTSERTPEPSEVSTRAARRSHLRRRHLLRRALAALLTVLVVLVGFVAFQVWSFNRNLLRSNALDGIGDPSATATDAAPGQDLNILVMGLDSRLDVHGHPLPADLYEALNAGDQSDGGMNSNVLMVFHIPGDGRRATAVSIPRDDQVALAGCPLKQCEGKVKQAYGLGFEAERQRLVAQGGHSDQEVHDLARDAGRRAQIATVQQFLGITIHHFVEVTMAAFYEVAQTVQPITVCLKQDTHDPFSGADFKAGEQQISAAQAVSFVRQRRDPNHPDFTDLDRGRRQQAFIISLLSQLRQAQTFGNPARVRDLLDVGTRNAVVDSRLDLLSFVGKARDMAGGNLTFYTLPIEGFGKNRYGEDVNLVNVPKIKATVASLFAPPAPSGTSAAPTPSATSSAPTAGASSGRSTTPGRAATASPTPVPTPVDATGGGKVGPAVTDLTELSSGGVPCVK